ncbi:MAG: hypothetical protein K0U78_15075 [Actinomycetia bacterium]|nr:hypothetical protein [Actinomycetes bacterium]
MKIEFLKIKLKNLAEESRIIRQKEKKLRGPNWGSKSNFFREHRVRVVRHEARHSHVIYGYLRGLEYKQIESNPKTELDSKTLKRILKSFSRSYEAKSHFGVLENWLKGISAEVKAA